jgi:hypothetical protein
MSSNEISPYRVFRKLHCPICGALVEGEVANGGRWPESLFRSEKARRAEGNKIVEASP